MQTILFHIYPALSHFYSSFKIAKILKDKGYRIFYAGPVTFQGIVEEAGFKYEIIENLADSVSYEIKNKGIIKFIYQSFRECIKDQRYKAIKLKITSLKNKVERISPDLVFLDTNFITIAVYYQYLGCKTAAITMMPYSGKDTSIPPFNSWLIPRHTLFSKIYVKYLWRKNKIQKRLLFLFYHLISFGQDEITLKKRFARETGFDFKKYFDYNRPFINGFKHLIELVLVPKVFDFPRPNHPNVHFIGLHIDRNQETDRINFRYIAVIGHIKQLKAKHDDVKLIYCSLGTFTHLDIKITECFFRKIASLCSIFKNFYFILSVGISYDVQKLLPFPPNMFVFPRVPQIDLLTHTDIMITHGGMNSILECIELNVPMLVYPLSRKWDQPGNSARVVYHGLGLRGNIYSDSTRAIARKISTLIIHNDSYKTNLLSMKEKFEENNKPSEVVKLIDKMISN